METKKITEKPVATACKDGMHLLITQPEVVNGVEIEALRRVPVETLLRDLELEQTKNKTDYLDDDSSTKYPSAKAVKSVLDAVSSEWPKYGVSGVGMSSATLTRLWDSVGKSASPGTDTEEAQSDFDGIQPFDRKKCVGSWSAVDGKAVFTPKAYHGDPDYTEDGTKGDYAAIDIRPFYWYEDKETGTYGVSEMYHPGWKLHPICLDKDGKAREHTYVPAYELALDADGHAVSLPGYHPQYGDYKTLWDKARTYDGGSMSDFAILEPSAFDHYNWLLMTIEFATQNMQTVMYGATSMRYTTDYVQIDGNDVNSIVVTETIGDKFVPGQTIYIGTTYSSTPSSTSLYNVVTDVRECDADGNLDDAGKYRLIFFDGDARTVTGGTTTVSSRPWITGSTNTVLGHTGSPVSLTNGIYPCKYRWMENPYGNINKTCLDLMDVRVEDGDGYKLQWYYNDHLRFDGAKKYFPSSTSKPDINDLQSKEKGWDLLSVETTKENYANGYISVEEADEIFPFVCVPTETKGGSANYYCDFASLVSSYVVRAVRRRGHLFSGAPYGPRFVYAHFAPSYGYWTYGAGLFMAQ